jgi:hypothetical protein
MKRGLKRRCRHLAFALLAYAVSVCSTAPVDAQELGGTYQVTGETASGTDYQGTIELTPRDGAYDVDWQRGAALEHSGFALQLDQVLGIVAEDSDADPGVVLYRVKGGHLEGIWQNIRGRAGRGHGREILDGPEGLEGEFTITLGRNPDGSSYYGWVTIRKSGAIYQVDWRAPVSGFIGTGVLVGDIFVVGYAAARRSGVAAYCVRSTATLDGITGEASDTLAGAEMLWRPDAKGPEDVRTRLGSLRKAGAAKGCGTPIVERAVPLIPTSDRIAAR